MPVEHSIAICSTAWPGKRRGLGQGLRRPSRRTSPCSLLGQLVSFLSHGLGSKCHTLLSTCRKAWALNGRDCGLQPDTSEQQSRPAEPSLGLKACGGFLASRLLTDCSGFHGRSPFLASPGHFSWADTQFCTEVVLFLINQRFFLFVFCQK